MHYNATVAVHFVMHWLHSIIMCIVYRLLVLGNFYEEYFMKKQKLNSFFYLLLFLNASVEGPPHLVLGDAPHLTCLDTQTSEAWTPVCILSPNTLFSLSLHGKFSLSLHGNDQWFSSTKPTSHGKARRNVLHPSEHLSVVKKDAIRS